MAHAYLAAFSPSVPQSLQCFRPAFLSRRVALRTLARKRPPASDRVWDAVRCDVCGHWHLASTPLRRERAA